jgi:hypothetical protein
MPKVRSVRTSIAQTSSYAPEPSVRLHLLHGLLYALRARRTAYLLERELALAAPQSLSHHGAHPRRNSTHPARLVLREVHEREAALAEQAHDFD